MASQTGLKNRDRPAAELQDGVRVGHTTEWPLILKRYAAFLPLYRNIFDLFLPCLNVKQQVKCLFNYSKEP